MLYSLSFKKENKPSPPFFSETLNLNTPQVKSLTLNIYFFMAFTLVSDPLMVGD